MGCGNYWGPGLYVGEQAASFAAMLHEKVPEAGVDTPLSEIAVMPIVSAAGPDFRRGLGNVLPVNLQSEFSLPSIPNCAATKSRRPE